MERPPDSPTVQLAPQPTVGHATAAMTKLLPGVAAFIMFLMGPRALE